MKVRITITPKGEVKVDVLDGIGDQCVKHVAAPLARLLGQPSHFEPKPDVEIDFEALAMIEGVEVQA